MNKLILNRFMMHPEQGTFGELTLDGVQLVCYTVERPWADNQPNISCIPPGEYEIHPFTRPNGDEVICLVNEELGITMYEEPGCTRFTILMHVANWPHDVEGCIGPGSDFVWGSAYRKKPMVTKSANSMKLVMKLINRYQIDKFVIHNPH